MSSVLCIICNMHNTQAVCKKPTFLVICKLINIWSLCTMPRDILFIFNGGTFLVRFLPMVPGGGTMGLQMDFSPPSPPHH